MKKVLTFLADGFEDIEAVTVIDLLRRANIEVALVSIKNKEVTSGSGMTVVADYLVSEIDTDDFDMVFLPGGGGVKLLDESTDVKNTVLDYYHEGKFVAAICAAPLILGKLGLLDHKNFTCYPSFESFGQEGNYTKNGVEVDDNIITGRGVGYANQFGLRLIEVLLDTETSIKVGKATLLYE